MTQAQPQPPVPEPLLEISAPRAIALFRRWLWVAAAFHLLMPCLLMFSALYGFRRDVGGPSALVAGFGWFIVMFFCVALSVRARRMAFDAAPLIAAGEFGLAEDRLSQAMKSFSVLRSTKLLGLQQLAMLRHAQARWPDAVVLTRELLARRSSRERELEVPSRLMLAESLLELGDTAAVRAELLGLAGAKLNLRESLMMTQVRLELEARLGDFDSMMRHVQQSLPLIELMPPAMSAKCHALLALAAERTGQEQWRQFLTKRARLLGDVKQLCESRPVLREVFADAEPLVSPAPS